MDYTREQKVLAIINLTEEFPNRYRVVHLCRWTRLSSTYVMKIDRLLELQLNRGHYGGKACKKDIKEFISDYIYCGKLKKEKPRRKVELFVAMMDFN